MEAILIAAWLNEQAPYVWFALSYIGTHIVDFLKSFSGKGHYRGDAQYSLVGL